MATAFTLLLLSLLPFAYSVPPSPAPAPSPSPLHPPRRPPTFPHSPPPRNPPTPSPSSPPRRPRRPSRRHRISISPDPDPQPPPTPSPAPASSLKDDPEFDSIADAMIGSGDFGNWIDYLRSSAGGSSSPLPGTATLFVPDDIALPQPQNPDPYPNQLDFDPFLYAYHVVPRRFSFAELRACPIGSRLPTLLPGNSIIITNNSLSNFTVNDSPITHPDLYLNGIVSVQGVGEALDYKKFGTSAVSNNRAAQPPSTHPPPQLVRSAPPPYHKREIGHGYRFFPAPVTGGATRSGSDFFFVFGFCILIKSVLIFIR